jgi:hypothetical protein
MLFILFLFISMVESKPANKTDKEIIVVGKKEDYQNIRIYVDLSEISKDGKKGTSSSLNVLVSEFAQNIFMLKHRLSYHSSPNLWNGNIDVYNWSNINHMPGFKKCDYVNAISCGIKNNHWTLRTVALITDKFSVVTIRLYDEKGYQIGNGSSTVFGTIRWKPKWKITKIRSNNMFGSTNQDIIEIWPPVMEELPPLITPYIISQAVIQAYDVKLKACKTKPCMLKR